MGATGKGVGVILKATREHQRICIQQEYNHIWVLGRFLWQQRTASCLEVKAPDKELSP